MTTDELPAATDRGVRCGHCSSRKNIVRHANVDDVRQCWAVREDWAANAAAEYAAEQGLVRHLETAAYDEHRDHERWEYEHGMVF